MTGLLPACSSDDRTCTVVEMLVPFNKVAVLNSEPSVNFLDSQQPWAAGKRINPHRFLSNGSAKIITLEEAKVIGAAGSSVDRTPYFTHAVDKKKTEDSVFAGVDIVGLTIRGKK